MAEQHAIIEEGAYSVINCAVPVICAVNGLAYGGGCELALCCDFIYAVNTAKFALPEVTRGIMPGRRRHAEHAPRHGRSPRAKEIMFTGKPFTAQQAYEWGMVNKLCEPGKLMDDALETARTIVRNAPVSVQMIKKAINTGTQTDLTSALTIEIAAYNRTVTTQDRLEGVLAFNEKRPPDIQRTMTMLDKSATANDLVSVPFGNDYPEIRESIRAICAKYPGSYWRGLEDKREYAEAFVNELTQGGWLAALIPEEFGGAGLPLRAGAVILEEIHASGCNAAACHAQMYMMKMLVRFGNDEQKQRYMPKIVTGECRYQAFGVTEPTTGSDTTQLKTRAVREGDHYIVNGQKLWTSRAHKSDLMTLLCRTTAVDQVKKRTEGLSILLVDVQRSARQWPDDRAGRHHDQSPDQRTVLRQPEGTGQEPDRRGGPGLSLHSRRHELRTGAGRLRDRSAIAAGSSTRRRNTPASASCSAVRSDRTRASSSRSRAPMRNGRPPTWSTRAAAAMFDAGKPMRRGGQHRQADGLGSGLARGARPACRPIGGFAAAREFDIERKWRECRIDQIAPISTNLILAYLGQNVLGMPRSY